MVMALLGDDKNNYKVKLWLQDHTKKILTIRDMKQLVKYLQDNGVKLYADVLEEDFNRFWKNIKTKEIKIVSNDDK